MTVRIFLKNVTPEFVMPAVRWFRRLGIRIGLLVFAPRLPQNSDGKIYLNLGCGYVSHPAFINVDATPDWHVHYCRPVDDLRAFRNQTVDLVYASHCLEHFAHGRVNAVLAEWFRVLRPGGVLRLGVPDFDSLIRVYEARGRDIESIQLVLMGSQDYPLNFHCCSFTRTSLTARLHAVGFREVHEWKRGVDALTSLPDFTGFELDTPSGPTLVSLNLEAVR